MPDLSPDPASNPPLIPKSPVLESLQHSLDALAESEQRYRRLFETARDGILILDTDSGRIADANPYIAELVGCAREEFYDKELWEIGLLPDEEFNRDAFAQLKREGYLRLEGIPVQTRRGETRIVEYISNVYRENGHTVIQCNVRDVTERRQAEADLVAAAAKNERIAETLQRSMLQAPPSGKFSGIQVETLYVAALDEAAVGGDFFDAFAFDGEKVALVVGDVSGKGLLAAGRTAEVKYALRAFLHEYQAPQDALAHLNDFVCETHRLEADSQEAFIILAVVVVDTATGEATFAAAGAEPTLILRADGAAERVEIIGVPLGILPNITYTAKTLPLEPGATVLMATDGITEARQGKAFLGIEGMAALAERAGPPAPLPELSAAIYTGAREFAGGGLHDDVCLLLARRQ